MSLLSGRGEGEEVGEAKENLEERPQCQDRICIADSSCFHTQQSRTGTDCPTMCPANRTERETKRIITSSLEPQMEKPQADR